MLTRGEYGSGYFEEQRIAMNRTIQKIAAPVDFDNVSLAFARQAAEFAQQHQASLSLIHVASFSECRGRFLKWFSYKGVQQLHTLTDEKTRLLHTWKRRFEQDYGITVRCKVEWGNTAGKITQYLREENFDLLLLHADASVTTRLQQPGLVTRLISESSCQVMTMLSGVVSLNQWKQVVLPVSGYVPEARLQAIVKVAEQLKLKIHLLNMTETDPLNDAPDFHYITETLKRIKAYGEIPVECKQVSGADRIKMMFNYSKKAGADLLMTNLHRDRLLRAPGESFYFMGFA